MDDHDRANGSRLRVVSVAHSACWSGSGRLRYRPLAGTDDIDLKLIIPERWPTYGRERPADPPCSSLDIRTRPVRFAQAPRAKWYFHYYPGLRRVIDELSPDVLHLWEEPWGAVALQATLLCQRSSSKTALILETEQNILRRLPPPFEQIRRYTLKRTDMLIARQQEALEVSRACGYSGLAQIVKYCVDRSCFNPGDRAQAKRDYAVDGFTIGYVGRLVPEKGLTTVLDALHSCSRNVRLLLLGDGPSRDQLQEKTAQLGLQDRVRFLPSQPQEQVAHLMNALDALVLMSVTTRTWKEQFGRVIIEAQACGTPVIGSSSGAIPSVIGGGGWVVQESDAAALAKLLDHLAAHPEQVAAAAERGLHNVTSFSPEAISSELLSAYREAAAHRLSRT
jgi:glycosyltransferase involved in cell wall biosynthesis